MYRDAYDDLVRAAELKRRRDRLRRQVAAASRQLEAQELELGVLEGALSKEERDVRKLEGLSLTGLVARAMGNREERLTKEAQEAEAAKLRCEAQRVTVEQLREQLAELRSGLEALGDVDADYQSAFVDKANALMRQGGETGAAVAGLAQELADVRSELKEIDEAAAAGKAAERHLSRAQAGFPDEDTSTGIIPIGTVMIPVTRENELSHDVETHLRQAQRDVYRFERELEDLEPWTAEDSELARGTRLLRAYVDDLYRPGAKGAALSGLRTAIAEIDGRLTYLLRWLAGARASAAQRHGAVQDRYVERVTHS